MIEVVKQLKESDMLPLSGYLASLDRGSCNSTQAKYRKEDLSDDQPSWPALARL